MRTIRVKLYKFSELSEKAKEKAIENYRHNGVDNSYLWDEAHESVKIFHEIFGTQEGNRSWLEVRTGHIDDNIMELKGIRLRTYIINNYGNKLYKRKYLGCIDDKHIFKSSMCQPQIAKNTGKIYTLVYSNIRFDNSCQLTGVCWDNSLLQPIYDFIEKGHTTDSFKYLTFEMLINDCFQNLEKDLQSEEEARNEDDFIAEEIEANEYEFTKDGNLH